MDLLTLRQTLKAVILMSEGAFTAIADDRQLRRLGVLLPFLLIGPGAAATVMYQWVLVGSEGMDRTETAIRLVIVGTPTAFAIWVGWAVAIEVILRVLWGTTIDRSRLLGAMGYASWPLVALWFFWLPDWWQGSVMTLGMTGVWIVASVMVIWFVYTLRAVQEIVSFAEERQLWFATTVSYLGAAAVLMAVGNRWAISPWISVFTRATDRYIG